MKNDMKHAFIKKDNLIRKHKMIHCMSVIPVLVDAPVLYVSILPRIRF